MASKIDPFAHLLGVVTDEKIAEMADVKPETVAAYRRKIEAESDDSEGESEPESPDVGSDDGSASPFDPAPPTEPEVRSEPEPEVQREPAPPCVRVRRGQRAKVIGPNGRSLRLRPFDIFRQEHAAWLWLHHRELVEPFPLR